MSYYSSIRSKGHIGTKNYKKLRRYIKVIKKKLNVEDVLHDLICEEVLSLEDGVFIRDKRVNHAMADSLIQKLIYVGKDGFEIFERVLCDNGYGYMIEQDEESKMSPVESSDTGNITRTTSPTHSQHHVHFSEEVPTQECSCHSKPSNNSPVKPSGTSIFTKVGHLPVQNSYPEDTVTISENLNYPDSPGKDDDDNQYFESSIRSKGHIGTKNYKKLQRYIKVIKENFNVEDVLDYLICEEVLSIEDGVFIRDKRVNHAMADSLIQKLIYVGKDGFEIFERVLRDNGYGYMIEQGDDGNQYFALTEYDDCSVGPKSENIILGKPIPYTGDRKAFSHWFPVVHMDGRLREFPGCHPDVDEEKIEHIVSEQKDNEGDYVIWFSEKRILLIITVIHRSSPKGRYHYKVNMRTSESEIFFYFSSQYKAYSVVELFNYVKAEGLPPHVQNQADEFTKEEIFEVQRSEEKSHGEDILPCNALFIYSY